MLNPYRAKRSFKETPEPKGVKKKRSKKMPIFVVQKHDATRLHYDFRLEHNGILLSWAVPKGPSLDPADKRLAIQVEDHPYEYHDFEGVIPKGQYGAGTVMVWDEGTYSAPGAETQKETEEAMTEGLKKGHLQFSLHGKKLNGLFHLVRLQRADNKPQWLLFKSHDEDAGKQQVLEKAYSVKTGRSLDEIAEGQEKQKKKSPL